MKAWLAHVSKSEVGEAVQEPGAWSMLMTLLGSPRSLQVKPALGRSHSSVALTQTSWSRLMLLAHAALRVKEEALALARRQRLARGATTPTPLPPTSPPAPPPAGAADEDVI